MLLDSHNVLEIEKTLPKRHLGLYLTPIKKSKSQPVTIKKSNGKQLVAFQIGTKNKKKPQNPKRALGRMKAGGLGRNRTTDTRIFNPEQ